MSIFESSRFLRSVLFADVAACLASGALQVAFTRSLVEWLDLPALLLQATGIFLLAYAAIAALAATRDPIPRAPVWGFVCGNFAWAAACVVLLAGHLVAPTALGEAWIVAQAVTVVVLAELQWIGLRRSRPIGWA